MDDNNTNNEQEKRQAEILTDNMARRANALGRAHVFHEVSKFVIEQSKRTSAKYKKQLTKNLDFNKSADVVNTYKEMNRFKGMDDAYNEILDFLDSKFKEDIDNFDKIL